METIDLDSWEKFPTTIDYIKGKYGIRQQGEHVITNPVLYRGQSDSNWLLNTTLERYSTSIWTISDYGEIALGASNEIESFTDKSWNLPDYSTYIKKVQEITDRGDIRLPCYEYLVYLRHHGFPSPLLDWTASSYIAAYFAFENQNCGEKVAIFVYIEHPTGVKSFWGGESRITVQGAYAKTHKRHFLQQSRYTICTMENEKRKTYNFVCHEKVFGQNNGQHQDVLFKITIPKTERIKVLSQLNEMNINAFSLFQTEESLMKTLAFKEFEM